MKTIAEMIWNSGTEEKEDVQQDNDFLFVRRDGANIAKKQPWESNHQSSNSETMNTDYLI